MGCKDNALFLPTKLFSTIFLPFFGIDYLCVMNGQASLGNLFLVFTKIGAFTIGGGYAMIPIIEREMASRGWIPKEELDDIVVLAQSAPGILAVNMAIYAGHRVRGVWGSVAATLGAVLPSFLSILLIAAIFSTIQDNPWFIKVFRGIRPVAIGLILVPMVNMARRGIKTWWAWLICIATVVAIALLKVSPIYIILVLIVGAVALTLIKQKL